MQDNITRTVTSSEARDVIHSVWAVIKTISSPLHPSVDNRSWTLIINGLNAPQQERFVKPIKDTVDRTRRFNPQTQAWETRIITFPRGRNKDTPFTKKTALTLIPPNGMINVFTPRYGNPIILIFDWRRCHRKDDRYIFGHNIVSDKKPWLWKKHRAQQKSPAGVALYTLQKQLSELKPGELAEQNELLGGLHHDAVIGIATPENTLLMRVNALSKKILMREKAFLDLPIFILDKNGDILDYTPEMQQADLIEVLKNNYPRPIKILAENCQNDCAPIEKILTPYEASPPVTFNFNAPKDLRRYIFSKLSFFDLVVLRQQIPEHAKPGLLRLKSDINFILKNIAVFYLNRLVNINVIDQFKSYPELLSLYRQTLANSTETEAYAHLAMGGFRSHQESPKTYALQEYSYTGTWGEGEVGYKSFGHEYHHNPLMEALLHQPLSKINGLIALHPQWVPEAIDALQKLHVFALKNGGSHRYKLQYDPAEVTKKWQMLAKTNLPKTLVVEKLDKSLKILAVESILSDIAATNNSEAVYELYQRHKNSPLLNSRRHPTWDKFCTFFVGPTDTKSKQHIIKALQEKAQSFHVTRRIP